MTIRATWKPRFLSIALIGLVALAAACWPPPGPTPTTPAPALPPRQAVAARLQVRLDADQNRALCEQLTAAFAAGDRDALRPVFDHSAFVERVIAHGTVPPETAAQIRVEPTGDGVFARFNYPDGSQFRCLGTRTFLGEPWIAIRQWTPTRFDYLLLRAGGAQLPIDDYHVVSAGFLQSELQAAAFDPTIQASMSTVNGMLEQSYRGDFAGIIAAYRTLPPALQGSPIAFFHYINAVYTTEPAGSPLYQEVTQQAETVLAGRDYALAYWRLLDAQRRGDPGADARARSQLIELLDDYELLAP
jgi:hypothetical protein